MQKHLKQKRSKRCMKEKESPTTRDASDFIRGGVDGAFLLSKSSFDKPFLYKKRFVLKRSQLPPNRHLRYLRDVR